MICIMNMRNRFLRWQAIESWPSTGEKRKDPYGKNQAPEEDILRYLEKQVITRDNPNTTETLKAVVEDSYRRLIAPAIEREIRSDLTEKAEDGAIKVFKKNLEQLLMQPPIEGQVVLGWDPAFRTGCKLAVGRSYRKSSGYHGDLPYSSDYTGQDCRCKGNTEKTDQKVSHYPVLVGNGTASRESEQVSVELFKGNSGESPSM